MIGTSDNQLLTKLLGHATSVFGKINHQLSTPYYFHGDEISLIAGRWPKNHDWPRNPYWLKSFGGATSMIGNVLSKGGDMNLEDAKEIYINNMILSYCSKRFKKFGIDNFIKLHKESIIDVSKALDGAVDDILQKKRIDSHFSASRPDEYKLLGLKDNVEIINDFLQRGQQ